LLSNIQKPAEVVNHYHYRFYRLFFQAKHGSDVSPKLVIPHHRGKVVIWLSKQKVDKNNNECICPCHFDLE